MLIKVETWEENSKLVLSELNRLNKSINDLENTVAYLRTDIAVQEVKIGRSSAFFGAISGMIVAILTAVIINYVVTPTEPKIPKVIYKENKQNETALQAME